MARKNQLFLLPRHLRSKNFEGSSTDEDKLREVLDTSTGVNRALGYTFVAFMFYILLIVVSTTDLQLFLPESTVRLPILEVELPLFGFYVVVPFIILIFHFHLLINLRQHQEKYKHWKEAAGPLASPIALDPLLINFLDSYPRNSLLRWLLGIIITISIFYFPLINLVAIQYRFGDYHSFEYSSWHWLTSLLDTSLIMYFFHTVLPFQKEFLPKRQAISLKDLAQFLSVFHFMFKPSSLVYRNFNGYFYSINAFLFSSIIWLQALYLHQSKDDLENVKTAFPWKYFPQWFFSRENLPKIDLTNFEREVGQVSDLFVKHYLDKGLSEEAAKQKAQKEFGKPIDLQDRDLRYAILDNLNLPGAQLQRAWLDSASLKEANLEGSYFDYIVGRGTNFQGVVANSSSFVKAQLQGADFQESKLQGVVCIDVEFQDVNLQKAQLQSAVLGGSLQRANLNEAHMEGVFLLGTKLHGASMVRAQLQGAVLILSELQAADLENAELQGASLSGTNLQGAKLVRTKLGGANFTDPRMKGAYLSGAELRGAKFSSPNWCDSCVVEEADWTSISDWNILLNDSMLIPEVRSISLPVLIDDKPRASFISRLKHAKKQTIASTLPPKCKGISTDDRLKLLPSIACSGRYIAYGIFHTLGNLWDDELQRQLATTLCATCPPDTLALVRRHWPQLEIPIDACKK